MSKSDGIDDKAFRQWYESRNIEERLSDEWVGRDHEEVMRDARKLIDEAQNKNEKAPAGSLAPQG